MATPLNRMLEDRASSRYMRAFAEQARTMPNSYCQLQSIDGKECTIDGKKLLNFNAINYLGLENHPRLIGAAQQAIARWGTLAGSARAAAEVALFTTLENRIASWLGVDNVIAYTTVTLANHGIIPLLMVKIGELQEASRVSQFFYDEGIHILTVGFPVLPMSRGLMLRISLSASHSDEQIDRLITVFRKFRAQSESWPALAEGQHDSTKDASRFINA